MYYQSWDVDLLWCVTSIMSQADKWNNSRWIYSFNRTVNSFMVSAFKSCFIFKGFCASSLRFTMFRKCLPQDPLHFMFFHCILENVYRFFFFLKCKRRTREQWIFKSQSCDRGTQGQEQLQRFLKWSLILGETRILTMNGKRGLRNRHVSCWARGQGDERQAECLSRAETFKDTSKLCSFQFESSLSIYEYYPGTFLVPCSVSHWEGPWWHRGSSAPLR